MDVGKKENRQPGAAEDDLFKIALVCTGNRCRSPIAEALIKQHGAELPIRVRSAGLLDLGKAPSLPEILELGSAHGLDLGRHRASYLGAHRVSEEDLVLGLERRHVAGAVVEGGSSLQKTFTLREFVALLDQVGYPSAGSSEVEAARDLVLQAHESRPHGFQPSLDVKDPFGGPRRGYEEMYKIVERLTWRLLQGLFPHATIGVNQPAGRS